MARGDIMNPVERPNTRYGMNPDEAKSYRLLSDPIEFSQNIARDLWGTDLDGLFLDDEPKQIDALRREYEYMLETALHRGDLPAADDVLTHYTEFVTYALGQAHEYGIALGAILEQFRIGLIGIGELSRRGLTYGDVGSLNDLHRLRHKHNLPRSGRPAQPDIAAEEKDLEREQKDTEAA